MVLSHYLELCKLRIGVMISLTAVIGYMALSDSIDAFSLVILALAVLFGSCSSSVLNHLFDRDIDRLMHRTRQRPLVTGAVSDKNLVIAFSMVLLLVGVSLLTSYFNWVAGFHLFLGFFVYTVIYTFWLKRKTVLNIVFGGAAGSFAILAGTASVDPSAWLLPSVMAIILFLWTPSHFWALAILLKEDYERADLPMLPCLVGTKRCAHYIMINSLFLVGFTLLPWGLGLLDKTYAVIACVSGSYFLWLNWRLIKRPVKEEARKVFFGSMIFLVGFFLAIVLDRHVI